ncbi:hypothetical protein HPP92_021192 [Vanilla planifolia]|uniref:Uncharacterized protein n=1 Tax=Vanilla planifolia TaxID=51239 RepID=A0A835UKH2_VANPL|nr:hypothetical protein HPP92_021563 [Vanilla planifolia]KAG0462716.1 hypothetical protein HPP92_021192 [Vanilla planifolia]
MAKHHPDLIMCRKATRNCHRTALREVRWKVCHLRLIRAALHACTLCDECNYGSFKEDVSSVEVSVSRMHITAKNALSRRKIEMDAPRLSTFVVPRLICSMKGKKYGFKKVRN